LPGSEQAHEVRAVKGAREHREWELQSFRPDQKIQTTTFVVVLIFSKRGERIGQSEAHGQYENTQLEKS